MEKREGFLETRVDQDLVRASKKYHSSGWVTDQLRVKKEVESFSYSVKGFGNSLQLPALSGLVMQNS